MREERTRQRRRGGVGEERGGSARNRCQGVRLGRRAHAPPPVASWPPCLGERSVRGAPPPPAACLGGGGGGGELRRAAARILAPPPPEEEKDEKEEKEVDDGADDGAAAACCGEASAAARGRVHCVAPVLELW